LYGGVSGRSLPEKGSGAEILFSIVRPNHPVPALNWTIGKSSFFSTRFFPVFPTPAAGLGDVLAKSENSDARIPPDLLIDPVRMASVSELKHCGAAVPGQCPGNFVNIPR